jgi:hypothetical protein
MFWPIRPSSGNGSLANCKGTYVNGTHNITLTNVGPHTKHETGEPQKGEDNRLRLKQDRIDTCCDSRNTAWQFEPENRCLRMVECAETGNNNF